MTQAQQLADLSQAYTAGPLGAFRNGFINGDFNINQRGGSSVVGTSVYAIDRWIIDAGANGNVGWTLSMSPFGGRSNLIQINQNTASTTGHGTWSQAIEDVRSYAGKRVVISGWFNAPSGKVYNIGCRQFFGSGGSGDVYAASPTTLTGNGALTYFSAYIDVPSTSGKTMGANSFVSFYFAEAAFSVHSVQFLELQLELGQYPTPFERVEIGTQLQRCQRYFEAGSVQSMYSSPATAGLVAMMFPVYYKVTKRTQGVCTYSNVYYYSGGSPTLLPPGNYSTVNANTEGSTLYITAGTTNLQGLASGGYKIDSEL